MKLQQACGWRQAEGQPAVEPHAPDTAAGALCPVVLIRLVAMLLRHQSVPFPAVDQS